MEMQPRLPGRQFLLREAVISLFALLLVWAAFDDIATDNATDFTPEYTFLAACAVWFGFVAVRLIRLGRRTLGMLSLVALLGALWAQRGIRPGNTPGVWTPESVVMIGVFLWFVALTATLAVLGWRGVPRHAISHQ